MQISGSLIRPLGNLSAENQTGRVNGVTQLTPADQPVQTNQTLRAVVEAKQAESMLLRTRSRQPVYQHPNSDTRSQHALSAYQSLQQSSERDYVSAVLGIDEYV